MISKEILGIIKSKRNRIFILLILLIPLLDLTQGVLTGRLGDYICNPDAYSQRPSGNLLTHPAFASFLSATTHGHLWQMIVVWLMPVFALNMFSDGYVLERSRKYTNMIYMRCEKRKYMQSKFVVAFIVPTLILGTSLMLNFGISQIIYRGGTSFNGLEIFKGEGGYFGYIFNNPNKVYFIYILMASIVTGLCSVFCQSMAFIFKEYKKTYAVSFFVWLILVICPYSITYLYQPFIEYGTNYLIKISVILITLVVMSVIVGFLKENRDEI